MKKPTNQDFLTSAEHHCYLCNKEFYIYIPTEWVYQVHKNYKGRKFFCSYTCWRKYLNEGDKK